MMVANPADSIVDSKPCRNQNFFYTSGMMIAFALGQRDGETYGTQNNNTCGIAKRRPGPVGQIVSPRPVSSRENRQTTG
jgi:hypothetical protein